MKKVLFLFAVLLTMAVSAKAQTQPINVVATECSAKFYAEDNDLYIVLQNSMYGFAFDVVCAQGSQDIVDGQTYTLTDMIPTYSYGVDQAAQNYIDYVSASITRVNGSYTATVVADDGNTYNITYNAVVTPEDTIAIVMNNAEVNTIIDYTSFVGTYQLIGADQNQEYSMLLAVNSYQIAGTYTQSDIDDYYSGLIHIVGNDTSYIDILSIADFTVAGNAKSCSTYVEILGNDHNLYQITYTYTYVAPDPVDTIEITMDNEELNMVYDQTFMGQFQLIGADQNDEYRMRLVVNSEQMAGNYTMSDVETFYTELTHNTATDTSYIGIEDIRDFTVVGDTTGCSTYIEILSTDLVLYKITYTYGDAPDPVSVENVNEPEFVIVSENNAIVVYTAAGEDIMVCDMTGRIIMNGKTASDVEKINVPMSGIYVVRIGNRAVNVLVK